MRMKDGNSSGRAISSRQAQKSTSAFFVDEDNSADRGSRPAGILKDAERTGG